MRELDLDAIAGQVTAAGERTERGALRSRYGAAVRIGVRAGLVPAIAVFLVYFIEHHAVPMPWARIAVLLAIYGPLIAVSLAVLTELFVAAFDRVARLGCGLVAIANPVTAGTLGGALAGVAPGAAGVVIFGSYTGPFVGTVLLTGALIAGAMLVAVPLARRARQARWPQARHDRVIIAAAVLATLILCAVSAVVAPVIVASAFAQAMAGRLQTDGPMIGAVAGVLAGAIVGSFTGLVIAIGRSLQPRRASTIVQGRGR